MGSTGFSGASCRPAPRVSAENGGVIQCFIENGNIFSSRRRCRSPPMRRRTPGFRRGDYPEGRHAGARAAELKKSVISTVSHQFRTPLTSLRMSIYLLLEEKIGPLNPEQLDLVISMRDDSERLTGIVNDLLDLNRISGRTHLKFEPRRPGGAAAGR